MKPFDLNKVIQEAVKRELSNPEYWRKLNIPQPQEYRGFEIPKSIRKVVVRRTRAPCGANISLQGYSLKEHEAECEDCQNATNVYDRLGIEP